MLPLAALQNENTTIDPLNLCLRRTCQYRTDTYDVDLRRLRKVPGLMTSSPLVDAALGYFSPLNLVTILSYLIVFMILLVPMVVCAKIFVKRNWFSSRNDGSSTNVSTNDVGSITAIKTLSCRSQRSIQNSGGPDHLAPLLMGRMSLFGDGIPGT